MLKELLKCSILISVVGCSSVPKEDHSSVLMEDVIVERTTVRSTTQNPKPKSTGGVYISGDNINIGTIIVNSPNAVVDKSTKVVSVNQQQNNNPGKSITSNGFVDFHHNPPPNQHYNTDANFFKGVDEVIIKILPSLILGSIVR